MPGEQPAPTGPRDPAPTGPLDPATLWRNLQRLVARVSAAVEGDRAIDDCLDILIEFLRADRGFVLLEQLDGTTLVVNARGPRRALSAAEREEVSNSIVRRAMTSDEMVTWLAADQPATSASVSFLGIIAAMAMSFRARGLRRGVVYVDFRALDRVIDRSQEEFFMAAVALMGGMLDQATASRTVRDQLEVVHGHVTESRRTPALEDLIAPGGMKRVRSNVELALAGDTPVLVLGESGSGKTLIAQALAEASARKPIVRVVLGGSDDLNTITSELFGHERGSFSGATSKRVGLVEYAHGGTLLLDEVLNLPPQAQKILLDFSQFGTYRPLGYDKAEPKRATVRIIAATNGDMRAAIKDGRFREDLYYRLAGVTIRVPALRERREDIPSLALSALRRVDPGRPWTLTVEARRLLASSTHAWPGNIRELEWSIRRARDRAVVRDAAATEIQAADIGELSSDDAAESPPPEAQEGGSLREAWDRLLDAKAQIEEREASILRDALARHNGVVAHAAKELGVARTTLAGRVEALGLTRRG